VASFDPARQAIYRRKRSSRPLALELDCPTGPDGRTMAPSLRASGERMLEPLLPFIGHPL
jgi:hypothetical protein